MTRITDISGYTQGELQSFAVFGIGSFILFVGGMVAIFWYQGRQAMNSQDAAAPSVISALTKAFMVLVFYDILVAGIFALLALAAGASDTNPAMGIWAFWHIDWLNPDVLHSVNNVKADAAAKESMKTIVMLMYLTKIVYLLLLAVLYLMILKFSSGIFLAKSRRGGDYDTADFGLAIRWAVVIIVSGAVVVGAAGVTEAAIVSVLNFAHKVGVITVGGTGENISFFDDFIHFLQTYIRNLSSYLSAR